MSCSLLTRPAAKNFGVVRLQLEITRGSPIQTSSWEGKRKYSRNSRCHFSVGFEIELSFGFSTKCLSGKATIMTGRLDFTQKEKRKGGELEGVFLNCFCFVQMTFLHVFVIN